MTTVSTFQQVLQSISCFSTQIYFTFYVTYATILAIPGSFCTVCNVLSHSQLVGGLTLRKAPVRISRM